jgi:hypothetical protein
MYDLNSVKSVRNTKLEAYFYVFNGFNQVHAGSAGLSLPWQGLHVPWASFYPKIFQGSGCIPVVVGTGGETGILLFRSSW